MALASIIGISAALRFSHKPSDVILTKKRPVIVATDSNVSNPVLPATTLPANEPLATTQPVITPATSPVVSKCATDSTAMQVDMWVWQPAVAYDSTKSLELFNFAESNNVKTVYLESEKLINSDQGTLGTFIANAKTHCIDVVLLYGSADWAFTRNHVYAVSLAQKSLAFSSQAAVTPVGIQFDVEPYNLDEYKADVNSGANQYIDMLEKIKSVTRTSQLFFAETMPLGFEYQNVTRNGITTSLSHATIDRVDRIALMDYRDTSSRIINDASDEVVYAASAGKKVVIGVETSCQTGEVETITFCEEGKAYMIAELTKVVSAYNTNSAFAGVAVHDYAAFKILR